MSKLHQITGSKCIICEEPLIKNDSILFHKTRRQTHSLCIDCGVGYLSPILAQATSNIRKNLRKGVEYIKCPGSIHGEHRNLCRHVKSLHFLNVPDCELSLDLFRLQYVLETPHSFLCPESKCGQVVEIDPEYVDNNLVCYGGCETSWCRNCLVSPYHVGKSCIEVEADNNNTENGKLIFELKNQGKLKFCPKCRAPSIKNNGCNKMVCGSCGGKWCWLCGQDSVDYDHFSYNGVGLCNGKLWEGADIDGNDLPEPRPQQPLQPFAPVFIPNQFEDNDVGL